MPLTPNLLIGHLVILFYSLLHRVIGMFKMFFVIFSDWLLIEKLGNQKVMGSASIRMKRQL